MSELLNDKMDTVGWHDKRDREDYEYRVFQWMRQATDEIRSLQHELEQEREAREQADASLERVLSSRTDHLV